MAINQVNTIAEEQNSIFLDNQSSILHTIETNDITVNGVNVIVNKPKKGDVMCITRYKENDVLLEADKQEVIWIDGLSINLKQLSPLFEPVGICISIRDNKALVRYKEEKIFRWSASERWLLPNSSIMIDGAEHTLQVTLNGTVNANPLILTAEDTTSRKAFVDKLNAWFLANDPTYSAELVELNTDLPAVDTTDTKDGSSYRNRIIVNARFTADSAKTIKIESIGSGTRAIGNHTTYYAWMYANNGFKISWQGGCCRAKYYDWVQTDQNAPSKAMTSINSVPGGFVSDMFAARLVDFTDNEYCQILRDNFASYDEYFDSKMIKCPCGAGFLITNSPSGKENTYKLAGCTFLDNTTGEQEILYPGADWVAHLSLNAPKLGEGNWWVPSGAEMVEMMRDVTYDTSFWDTKPDIINRVLAKLNSFDNNWTMLSAKTNIWTSNKSWLHSAWHYFNIGVLNDASFFSSYLVAPLTLYEF